MLMLDPQCPVQTCMTRQRERCEGQHAHELEKSISHRKRF